MLWLTSKADLRRMSSIHAYCGSNGGGKSLAMVNDSLRSMEEGRLCYSTVRLVMPDGSDHPAFVPLTSFMDLMDVEHADILLDEVTGAVNSRASMGLPVQFQNLLVQLRRRDCVLRWTSPNFARADTILRGVTQAVTMCKGYLPKTAEGRLWPERRLFRWVTYDARDWEEVTAGKLDQAKPLAREFFWRPGSKAESSYNTLAPVYMLDHLSEAGICANCGGKRSHPRCECQKKQRGQVDLPEEVTPELPQGEVTIPPEWLQ